MTATKLNITSEIIIISISVCITSGWTYVSCCQTAGTM